MAGEREPARRPAPNEKYFRGTYALCPQCGARPCVCDQAATPPLALSAPAPAPSSSTAAIAAPVQLHATPPAARYIDFRIWDELIERYSLGVHMSSVLLLCYRESHGRGMHYGAPLSIATLAAGLRCSKATVKRCLRHLETLGLLARTRRHERVRGAYLATIIAATLPTAESDEPTG
jgi:hypothetical protein